MMRLFIVFILLFSFSDMAIGEDACCKDEATHSRALGKSDAHADDHSKETTDCSACVRCFYGLGLPTASLANSDLIASTEIYPSYRASFAPAPDILGLLRPPIS